jgi:FAD/FMN-containing dehydrogenase
VSPGRVPVTARGPDIVGRQRDRRWAGARPVTAKIVAIDPQTRTAVVEPGVILSELAAAVEAHTDGNLTCARNPSSKSRATIGGSVGT